MQREIKFRAWFKDKKEMREVAMLRWEDGRMSRIAGYNLDTRNNGWTDYDPEGGKIELLQFTGLKDKNGKEIYEGDVIRHGDNLYEIMFDTKVGGYRGYQKASKPNGERFRLSMFQMAGREVIGNIHEHPDLLK